MSVQSQPGRNARLEAWAERYAATPERPSTFTTLSGARVHATEGEIVAALQDVWGNYTESPVF